jgi:hypothetical protein
MNRRSFVNAATGLTITSLLSTTAARAADTMRTKWRVRESDGLDAVIFLGPLSDEPLYQEFYAAEAAEFGNGPPAAIRADITSYEKKLGRRASACSAQALPCSFPELIARRSTSSSPRLRSRTSH